MSLTNRAVTWIILAIATCAVTSTGLIMFANVGGEFRRPLCLTAEAIAMLAAAGSAHRASRRVIGADRQAWSLLTTTIVVSLAGMMLGHVTDLGPWATFSSTVLAAPLAFGALIHFASGRPNPRVLWAAVLEAFLTAGGVFVTVWIAIDLSSSGTVPGAATEQWLLMLNPFAFLLIAGLAGAMYLSAKGRARRSMLLLVGWASLTALASTLTLSASTHGDGAPPAAGFLPLVGVLLLVGATAHPSIARGVSLHSHRARAQRGLVTVLPMVLVLLSVIGDGLGLVSETAEILALALIPASIARMIIASRESQDLVGLLENRVALLRVREREMIEAREAAVAAQQAERVFLTHTSHELRTPLHAILGFAELVSLEELTDSQTAALCEVRRSSGYLLELVDDLLDLAQVERGTADIQLESVVVADVMTEIMHQMDPVAAKHRATIDLADNCAPGTSVLADGRRLRQVIVNLVTNAVKYAGGQILVETEKTDGVVQIHVTDTGPGIDPSQVDRLFVPFDRLGADAGEEEGDGVGLPLSGALMDAMDGEIEVDSAVGVGSRFTVSLPTSVEQRGSASALQIGYV